MGQGIRIPWAPREVSRYRFRTPEEESFSASMDPGSHVRALCPGPRGKAADPLLLWPFAPQQVDVVLGGRPRARGHWQVFAATSRRRCAAPQPSAPPALAGWVGWKGLPLRPLRPFPIPFSFFQHLSPG